jgi:hypothetical protein
MNGCHAAFPSPSLSIPLLSLDLCWDGEDDERRMRREKKKMKNKDQSRETTQSSRQTWLRTI